MNVKNLLDQIKTYIKNLVGDVQAIYLDYGIEPFKKQIIISIIIIFGTYFIYNSSKSKLYDARDKVEWLEALKNHYEEYINSKNIIKKYSNNIPAWKDKDDFLNYILTNIASKNGITFSAIESQKETNYEKIYYVSKQVKFTTTFEKLISFLAEIEKFDIFIEISQIKITKKESLTNFELLDVDLTVATVFINL